jgi:hypothetical protein
MSNYARLPGRAGGFPNRLKHFMACAAALGINVSYVQNRTPLPCVKRKIINNSQAYSILKIEFLWIRR